MPPLVPSFMMPQWLKDAPIPIQMALLLPGLIVGNILAIAVHAIMINLGAGNQHLSSANGGFDAWLLWIIIGAGLFIGLAAGGFVYIGVGSGRGQGDRGGGRSRVGDAGVVRPLSRAVFKRDTPSDVQGGSSSLVMSEGTPSVASRQLPLQGEQRSNLGSPAAMERGLPLQLGGEEGLELVPGVGGGFGIVDLGGGVVEEAVVGVRVHVDLVAHAGVVER